jgi:hypothetical protein
VDPQNQSKIRLSNEELKVHDLLRGKKYYAVKIWEEQTGHVYTRPLTSPWAYAFHKNYVSLPV